jgi:hypothetical protein
MVKELTGEAGHLLTLVSGVAVGVGGRGDLYSHMRSGKAVESSSDRRDR